MGNAVQGATASLKTWIESTGIGNLTTVAPGGIVDRAVAGLPMGAKYECLRRIVYPSAVVADLPKAAIGSDGAIITQDGCLALDTISQLFVAPHIHKIWTDQANETYIPGRIGVAMCRGNRNFSHVLADLLPRVWQIRRAGPEPEAWITPANPPEWLEDLLDMIGIRAPFRLSLNSGEQIRADRLLVGSGSGFAPMTAPWVLGALGELIGPPGSGKRRILVRRVEAPRRRWIQEEEAVEILAKWDIEPVIFERLSIAEQLQITRTANVIVGPHGAGLAHILCAGQNGLLLEVTDPKLSHVDFWGLAAIAGWQFARTAPSLAPFDAPEFDHAQDIDQPVESVVDIIRLWQ